MSSATSAPKAIIHRLFPRRTLSKMSNAVPESKPANDGQASQQSAAPAVSQNVNRWGKYVFGIYMQQKPPLLGSVRVQRITELTKEKMKDREAVYGFIFESAGISASDKHNREAFDDWRIIPRVLRDNTQRNVETTIFGKTYPSPLLIAPIGMQAMVHPEGEVASARAAASLDVPFIMSSASSRSIEDIAAANGNGERWFQIYWPKSEDVTISLLNRAEAAGYSTLVLTVDSFSGGWRPYDLDTAFIPFIHCVGCAIGITDPVFMKKMGLEPWVFGEHLKYPYEPQEIERRIKEGDEEAAMLRKVGTAWLMELYSGIYHSWEELAFLKKHWKGRIVLKGILSPEDAEMAVDYVDGIVVSSHGGRQLDGEVAALDALSDVCLSEKVRVAQESGKFTVLFDSGIRTGTDIIKAIALGAQGVLLGRPYMQGLVLGGEAGVAEQIKVILCEFETSVGLSGYKDIKGIQGNRSVLTRKGRPVV